MFDIKRHAKVRVRRNPNGTYSVQWRAYLLGIPLVWCDAEVGLFDADNLEGAIEEAHRMAGVLSYGFETVYEIK